MRKGLQNFTFTYHITKPTPYPKHSKYIFNTPQHRKIITQAPTPRTSFNYQVTHRPEIKRSHTTVAHTRPVIIMDMQKNVVPYQYQETFQKIKDKTKNLSPTTVACLTRIVTGAMSFGSISEEAHVTLAIGVNLLAMAIHGKETMDGLSKLPYPDNGPMSNSGEGGERQWRDNTIAQSRIRQFASARFGVDGRYLVYPDQLQTKNVQTAKNGYGGELPAEKVTAKIAEARKTQPGITQASPNPLQDEYSIESKKQTIYDKRSANPRATMSVKLGSADGVGVIAAGVAKCGTEDIYIGGPGGTGAAPLTAKMEGAMPGEFGVAEAHQTLEAEGMRSSVTLTTGGGIQTGWDCFIFNLLGADRIEVGTSALITMGCTKADVCENNTCPTGIATQNQELIDKKFKGDPEQVANYLIGLAESWATYLIRYGFNSPAQARGRTDLLYIKDKAPITGLESLLYQAKNPYAAFGRLAINKSGSSYTESAIITQIRASKTDIITDIKSSDLSIGARINYWLVTDPSFAKILQHPVTVKFNGIGGQSFGFLLPKNLKFLTSHSNDGTGKSLDGGEIYHDGCVGDITGYGATSGKIMARFAGERALVRNSGAIGIFEQLGAMSANYMTGGYLGVLASPKYYSGITFNGSYTPPVLFRDDMIGPNFGANFNGGQAVMPKALYKELLENNYLSSHARKIKPQELSDTDLAQFVSYLKEYRQHINSPWIDDLIANPAALKTALIRLDPSVKHIEAKLAPQTISFKKPITSVQQLLQTEPKKIIAAEEEPIKLPSEMPTKFLVSTAKSIPKIDNPIEQEKSLVNKEEKDACGTGAIINLQGEATHEVLANTITMLQRFAHRGATGIDPKTSDGWGITCIGADSFFQKQFPHSSLKKHQYSIIPINMAENQQERNKIFSTLESLLAKEGLRIADFRQVPTNRQVLGLLGQQQEHTIQQYLVLKPESLSIEDFEKMLIKTRLRFDFHMQEHSKDYTVRPDIYSASPYHVIYKSLASMEQITNYFVDFQNRDFKVNACVPHARFATNTLPKVGNIQPFSEFANNGENNTLEITVRLLTHHPLFKNILGIDSINLTGMSDSRIMAIYMAFMRLLGYSPENIVASTIHRYDPKNPTSHHYNNLFWNPFEGPNASMATLGNKIILVRDKSGFRPLRGIVNEKILYAGSELGGMDITGQIFDLPPATLMVIDLETRKYSLYHPEEKLAVFQTEQMQQLYRLTPPEKNASDPITFTAEELDIRKLRAGWNKETDKMLIQPLLEKGKPLVSSMGDQGPFEALVKGAFFDLANFFKYKFAQVTNPPLAVKEEEAYMLTLTFVGKKPALENLNREMAQGVLLPSPIVNNHEILQLQNHPTLKSFTIDITYNVFTREKGLQAAIERVVTECIYQVEQGITLLTLSDLSSDHERAAIPPVLIASAVDQALLERGLRRNVSIALQAGAMLAGRDIAQAISIGGVDVINPYLPFIDCPEKQAETYKEGLRRELLAFKGCKGISSTTAYRGNKDFNVYGINPEVLKLYGLKSKFGGIDWANLAQILLNNHTLLKREGLGKYDWQGQIPRQGKWNPEVVRNTIDAARTGDAEKFRDMERKANAFTGDVRRYLVLKKPMIWNKENPMTICIIGGGAGGFYTARALLDSGLPINIIIIEQKHGNKIGEIGDGIAPDHEGTKNQADFLSTVLDDPRVQYFGGIEIGQRVKYEHLKEKYPCIIDCRGAMEDIKLDIPGADLPGVVYATQVYQFYNDLFDPFNGHEIPLTKNNKNPAIGIIGGGNVAADLARILLKNPENLQNTSINSEFLEYLKQEGPMTIRMFARGNPSESKIGLKELKELEKLDIWLTANFEPELINTEKLTEQQKEVYDFFLKIRDRKQPMREQKHLHFYFQVKPKEFQQSETETELTCIDAKGNEQKYRAKNFIIAIGRKPMTYVEQPQYISGWRRGNGGTLNAAEKSAQETAEQIKKDFYAGKFHHRMEPAKSQPWQLRAVDKEQFKNIRAWLKAKRSFKTVADFFAARNYRGWERPVNDILATISSATIPATAPPANTPPAIPGSIVIQDSQGKVHNLLAGNSAKFFKDNFECGGTGVCLKCSSEVITSPQAALVRSNKEKVLLTANKENNPAKDIVTCMHEPEKLAGGVYRLKK